MERRAGATASRAAEAAGAPSKKILVVDDEPDMLELLCAVLRAARPDAIIRGTTSPDEALQLDDGEPVDLLVTDYMMPALNGLELAQRFRERRPRLPIILLTAFPDASVQNEAFVARVNVFMKKPVDPREFISEVSRALATP